MPSIPFRRKRPRSEAAGEVVGKPLTGPDLDLKFSAVGFDLEGGARTGQELARRSGNTSVSTTADSAKTVVALTSFSPRTGNPTLTQSWADDMTKKLREKCPSGTVTNLAVLRETASYPYISGEIVRVKAICVAGSKKSP